MKKEYLALFAEFFFIILFAIGISGYLGIIFGISLSIFLFFLLFLLIQFRLISFPSKNSQMVHMYNSLLVSVSFAVCFTLIMIKQIHTVAFWQNILMVLSLMLILSGPIYSVLYNYSVKRKEINKNSYVIMSLSLLIASFIFLIFIPSELFLNNTGEFKFSLLDLNQTMGVLFTFSFLGIFLISFLPERVVIVISSVINGLIVGGYVQYMFFNFYIKELSGGSYHAMEHPLFSFVNAGLWIVIVGVFVFLAVKNKKIQTYVFGGGCVVLLLFLTSFVFLLVKTPVQELKRKQYYLSGAEQFTVGKNANIIVFILDGVDNSFVKEIYKTNPEIFDDYKDFTMYSDTCSVYDFSASSIQQFLYGYTYYDGTDRSLPFQQRLKNNGYRFLPFNEYAVRNPQNIDNYLIANDSAIHIRYDIIRKNMLSLSCYQLLPCLIKGIVHSEKLSFGECTEFTNRSDEIISDNHRFEDSLNLTFNEYSDRCFIYQHLSGAHYPCDYIEETKYCLGIFAEYLEQLKEMGVYDNSTIILAADHGAHDDTDDFPFPSASTPLFMVKGINEHNKSMIISDVPMYYIDFQPTILYESGLFNKETDYELFGKPVEDYDEKTTRTRSWFDTGFAGQKTRKYTYTGNTDELERVVREDIYEETDSYVFLYQGE